MKNTIKPEYILPKFLKNLIKFRQNKQNLYQFKKIIIFGQTFDHVNLILFGIGVAWLGWSLGNPVAENWVLPSFGSIQLDAASANFNQNNFNLFVFRVIPLCCFLLSLGGLPIWSNRAMMLRVAHQSLGKRLLEQGLLSVLLGWLILRGLIRIGVQPNFYSLEQNEIMENLIDLGSLLILIAWLPYTINHGRYSDTYISASESLEPKQQIEQPPDPPTEPFQPMHPQIFSTHNPLMLHTDDGEILQLNESWVAITGYTQSELPTTSAWIERFQNPQPLPTTQYPISSYRLPGNVQEYTITTGNGNRRVWEWSSMPLGKLTDERTVILSTVVDITEEKQLQTQIQHSNEQLQLSLLQWTAELSQVNDGLQEELDRRQQMTSELCQVSERLQQLLRTSPAVIFSCQPQPDYPITFISDNVGTLLGYNASSFLNQSGLWHQYVPKEEQLRWQGAFSQLLSKGTQVHESRFLHGQGYYCWLRIEMRLVKDNRGNPLEIVGYLIDISKRRQAEMSLLTTQNRLKTVIETVGSGITLSDEQGNFYIFNPQMTEITGYTQQEAQSNFNFMRLLYPYGDAYKKAQERLETVVKNGSFFNIETTIYTKDGHLKTLLLTTVLMIDHKQRLFLSTFQDITPLKRAEKALYQLLVQEHLVWEITHHIRQSLNLDDILNTTVTEVQQLLECDQVVIYRAFSAQGGNFMAGTSYSTTLNNLEQSLSATHLLPRECYKLFAQGKLRVINDINKDSIHCSMLNLLKGWGVKSAILVPLFELDQLWGLLIVYQHKAFRSWLHWEGTLLRQIAEQVGIAVQQSQLYQQTQYQARRAQTLNHVIQVIRQSLDLDTIFSTAVAEIVKLLQVDRACIWQRLLDEQQWKEVASCGMNPDIASSLPDFEELHRVEQDKISVLDAHEMEHLTGIAGAWLPIPLRVGSQVWGCLGLLKYQHLGGWKESEIELTCAIADQLAIAIQQSELYQELQLANEQLKRLVTVDGLTQVANRRRFDEYLEQEWQRLHREQAPLSLIMCDLDYFKQYNDYYGHPAGDSCLKRVAQTLEQTLRRPADLVARYGGEEFVIVLPYTNPEGATYMAQQIQEAILQMHLPHADSKVSNWVTLSLGVSCTIPNATTSAANLIDAADHALYEAKAQGRARYCFQSI